MKSKDADERESRVDENAILEPGSTGDGVREIQRQLASLGIARLEIDGVFGEETAAAVRRFQSAEGLAVDGIVGPATSLRLSQINAGSPRSSARKATKKSEAPPPRLELGELDRAVGSASALEVTGEILVRSPTLAENGGRVELPAPATDAPSHTVAEWIEEIRPFFDPPTFSPGAEFLLWGLALLDPQVGKALSRAQILESVASGTGEEHLTAEGKKRWDSLRHGLARKNTAAPTLLDRSANDDLLGRRAFAIALAARLVQLRATYLPHSRVRATPRLWYGSLRAWVSALIHGRPTPPVHGPFLVHLHGVWGVGKTSLLNFMAANLRQPTDLLAEAVWGPDFRSYPRLQPWVVVNFNAWQHQRVAPPWWWLMTAVYFEGARGLPFRRRLLFRLRDYWWRFWIRWPSFVIPVLALVVIGSIGWYLITETTLFARPEDKAWYQHVAGIATAATAMIATLVTVWAGVNAAKRWVLVGTARGAENFLRSTADPLSFVQRRYSHLVRTLGRPVAVVIDDLDRCRPDHVVNLLEGINTLFGQTPATYIVAADRWWLRECFTVEYAQFADESHDPGRPLGDRFLEKTFQLATSVPRLDPQIQKEFIDALLRPETDHRSEDAERSGIQEEVSSLASEQEFRVAVHQSATLSARKQAELREALVVRASAVDIVRETEYLLSEFSHLMEPNPRAMKRLVNAYGFEAKLQLLEGNWEEPDPDDSRRLVLWTIASLRWPALAEFLVDHPDAAAQIGNGTGTDVPRSLKPLLKNNDVIRVFRGERVGVSLRPSDIRRLARLPPTGSPI